MQEAVAAGAERDLEVGNAAAEMVAVAEAVVVKVVVPLGEVRTVVEVTV